MPGRAAHDRLDPTEAEIFPVLLRAALKGARISSHQLSAALGIPVPSIEHWRAGDRAPPRSRIASLMAHLAEQGAVIDIEHRSGSFREPLTPPQTTP